MEAIILAGGFGTRLHHIVKDVPKPMADINGKPFLSLLLEYLRMQGMLDVLLSVGHMRDVIMNHYGSRYKDLNIRYVIEESPLGTGGALREALKALNGQEAIVLNGDTLFLIDLRMMVEQHRSANASLTLAVKPMKNIQRYGTVVLHDRSIASFEEKSSRDQGYINGGIYIVRRNILNSFSMHDAPFSFERDYLYKHIQSINAHAFISDAYFIDIGIPEDLQRARQELHTTPYWKGIDR